MVECNQHYLSHNSGSGQIFFKIKSLLEADSQGMIVEDETVSIKFLLQCLVDGMQFTKVSNKGNDAPGNGVPGDLIVCFIEELET
jgi:molecular chaperone DnaJ